MSLSDKSNQDINKWIFRIKKMCPMAWSEGEDCVYQGIDNDGEKFDWINDDALAFRLMVDNKIGLNSFRICVDSPWLFKADAFCNHAKYKRTPESDNENPNRAIAECYLLMNGVES